MVLRGEGSAGEARLQRHSLTNSLGVAELGLVLQIRSVLEGHLELLLAQSHADMLLLLLLLCGGHALGPHALRLGQGRSLGDRGPQGALRLGEGLAVGGQVLLLLLDHVLLKLELNHLLLLQTSHLVLGLVLALVLLVL